MGYENKFLPIKGHHKSIKKLCISQPTLVRYLQDLLVETHSSPQLTYSSLSFNSYSRIYITTVIFHPPNTQHPAPAVILSTIKKKNQPAPNLKATRRAEPPDTTHTPWQYTALDYGSPAKKRAKLVTSLDLNFRHQYHHIIPAIVPHKALVPNSSISGGNAYSRNSQQHSLVGDRPC